MNPLSFRSATRTDTGCPPGTVVKNIYLATLSLDYEDLQSYMLTVTLSVRFLFESKAASFLNLFPSP